MSYARCCLPYLYQVQAPFETRPGEIPRRIQIERKRRLYLQHRIEDLLLDRGVDHSQPPKSALAFLSPSIPPIPVEVRFYGYMCNAGASIILLESTEASFLTPYALFRAFSVLGLQALQIYRPR